MRSRETAEYVRNQLVELERIANKDGLGPLAYILHMAILEADNVLSNAPTPINLPNARH